MKTGARALLLAVGIAAIGWAASLLARPAAERYVASKAFCAKCHGAQTSHLPGHERMACGSCHAMPQNRAFSSLLDGLRGAMPPHGKLEERSCKSCHEQDAAKWQALAGTAGHSLHASGEVACVRCHGSSLHGKPSESERCGACHQDTVARLQNGPQLECTRCHVFGGEGDRSRSAPKPGAAIWGSNITGARVHGAADCQLCHNPHLPEGDAQLTAKIDCTSCHRGDLARSVTHAPDNHQQCTTCHRPHGLRSELKTACTACHEKPRVRGETRDPGVPEDKRLLATIAPILAAREASGVPPKIEVTHGGECAKCHAPHSWAPDKQACMTCHEHEQKAKQIAALPKDSHSCLGCHEPHSKAPGKEACEQCHADKLKSLLKAVPAKHHDCLSCHEPHQGKPQAFVACGQSCHRVQSGKLRDGQIKHRDCVNCHEPHADPKRGAVLACKNCHEDKVRTFANSKHETCARCHGEHVFDAKLALAGCGNCHQKAVAQGAPHHEECTKCHTPHAPGLGPASSCRDCHQQITPKVPQHQQCNNCHKPHEPAAAVSAQCGHCHQSQAKVATHWPSNSPHAPGQCAQCHTKHEETVKRDCRSCHSSQARPQHMGVHEACTGCHTPHVTPPTDAANWWGRCANCHKSEGTAAASGNPKHQLCANCHANDGRKPTPCLGCHTDIRSQGEHQQQKHDQCVKCHATHGTSPPVRKACESCHTDRLNHFPDAPKCQSCHPFTKQ